MENDGMGFGNKPDGKTGPLKEYIGEYVLISFPATRTTISGNLISVEENYFVLSPYQGGDYDEEGKLVVKILNGSKRVTRTPPYTIEPTTRTNIENFCLSQNRELRKEEKEGKKKGFEGLEDKAEQESQQHS